MRCEWGIDQTKQNKNEAQDTRRWPHIDVANTSRRSLSHFAREKRNLADTAPVGSPAAKRAKTITVIIVCFIHMCYPTNIASSS